MKYSTFLLLFRKVHGYRFKLKDNKNHMNTLPVLLTQIYLRVMSLLGILLTNRQVIWAAYEHMMCITIYEFHMQFRFGVSAGQ